MKDHSGPQGLVPVSPTPLDLLKAIPEEELWLQSQQSPGTRLAYRSDVVRFMRFLQIRTTEELRKVDRGAVIAWKRELEITGTKPITVRRKLAALSSLFSHLVHHQVLSLNPCREIRRPRINRRSGATPAFSPAQARAILDAPDPATLQGLRDRAILSVGFQAGPRRASIVRLRVRDFREDAGFDTLVFQWKGGHEHRVALHPQTTQRIRDYFTASGHAEDLDGPLFRPVRSRSDLPTKRALRDQAVARILQHYARRVGVKGRYSAHSMRATFITVALQNGASLEDVQAAAGHADPSTTKLYDKRGYNPEKSAAFFANY
jgi:integrase/recombinase XerD